LKNLSVKYILLAILACLLWSTAFAGIKIGLKYTDPLSFAGIRFMLSGIMLLFFAGNLKTYFRVIKENFQLVMLLSIVQTFLVYALFYTGITMIDGALAAIIIGSAPLISAISAHFLMEHDKMTIAKTISLVLGFVGITIIALSRKPWMATGFRELTGILILLVSTTSGSLGNIIVSKNKKVVHPMIFSSAQLFIGGFLLLLLSLPIEGLPTVIYAKEYYLALGWLSFLSAGAFAIWFNLLKKPEIKVSELNLWKFIIPVFGAVFSWILLPEESPEIFSVVGMIFVAISIILFNHYAAKETLVNSKKQ